MINYTAMRSLTQTMKGESEQYIENMLQKLMDFIPSQYSPEYPLSLNFDVNDSLSIMDEMDPDSYLEGSSFNVQYDLNGVLTFSEFKHIPKLFWLILKDYLLKNGFSLDENATAFSKNIL